MGSAVTATTVLMMIVWGALNAVFVQWRVGALASRGGRVDAIHDWAIQGFVRGSSLAFLVLLFAMNR